MRDANNREAVYPTGSHELCDGAGYWGAGCGCPDDREVIERRQRERADSMRKANRTDNIEAALALFGWAAFFALAAVMKGCQ